MSKRSSNKRLVLIINKLRNNPCSYNDLYKYFEEYSDFDGDDYLISKRTFQRDLNDIRSVYNIDIQYNRVTKKYFIEEESDEGVYDRIFEAVDTINALNLTESISKYVDFEKRKPKGTEHLYGLIHAVKNKFIISFNYQKYWDEIPSYRTLYPLGIKEAHNRWYVIAKDMKDQRIKTFALDRISLFQISNEKFSFEKEFSSYNYFKNSFGIITPDEGQKVEEVILKFDTHQGKYIKSLPLHHSQVILEDTESHLIVSVKICITYDFKMEVLSYGERVKVLQPKSFIKEIVEDLKSTILQYDI
jgi:predicted DNA-binding transcriptional regulator YafY